MSIKNIFLLIALMGFMIIIFKGLPLVDESGIFHTGLFSKERNLDISDYRNISYTRFGFYISIWFITCFLCYQIATEFLKKRNK